MRNYVFKELQISNINTYVCLINQVEMSELTIYSNVFILSVRYNIINMLGGLVWLIVIKATFNNSR